MLFGFWNMQCTIYSFIFLKQPQMSQCAYQKQNQFSPRSPQTPKSKTQCGKGRGICPADIESRLQEYSNNTQNLVSFLNIGKCMLMLKVLLLQEKQLGDMENEVKNVQKELTAVQKEREHLEHHRKMFCPPPPCAVPPCMMPRPCMMEEEKPVSTVCCLLLCCLLLFFLVCDK